MTEAEKRMKKYLRAVKRRLNLPSDVKKRVMTDFVSSIDNEVDVMWGLYKAPDLGNKVKITILASGFNVTVDTENPRKSDISKPDDLNSKIDDNYGADRTARMAQAKVNIIHPDQLDDEGTMADLESQPAAARRGRFSTAGKTSAENNREEDTSKSMYFNDL